MKTKQNDKDNREKNRIPTAKIYAEKKMDESSREKIRQANRPHASVPLNLI